MNETTHAIAHCSTTIPTVRHRDFNSRLMVATAATQGVYSRENSKKLTAVAGVNIDATVSPFAISTSIVLTTASLAVKPVISDVGTRQSSNPSGRKIGEMTFPIPASRP